MQHAPVEKTPAGSKRSSPKSGPPRRDGEHEHRMESRQGCPAPPHAPQAQGETPGNENQQKEEEGREGRQVRPEDERVAALNETKRRTEKLPNENTKQDHGLISLLAQAENPSIETRDQFKEEQTKPDNPHIAPGWNAIMVRDIISGMFTAEAAARGNENWDDTGKITDAEMEQAAPGITRQVAEIVTGHIPSNEMYSAMYAEVRELAQTAVTEMNPRHREALLDAGRKKVREARAGQENE